MVPALTMRNTIRRVAVPLVLVTIAIAFGACAKSKPPVARPQTPSGQADPGTPAGLPARPPEPVAENIVPPEPRMEDPLKVSDIDKINQNSPFQPVLFAYDSSEIEGEGQQILTANAAILKKYPEWVITIEGHSDERGTAEYNLALGNRRASAARAYLISLGIPADRLRTVSYGKEFPFDPSHTESGWSKNRRAHFVLTSK
jgi:peptidoglycan-associated lipoprotein